MKMKKISLFLTLLLSLSLSVSFVSCKDDDDKDKTPTNTTTDEYVKANVNGTSFSSSYVVVVEMNGKRQLAGSNGNKQITVNIPLTPSVGTYSVANKDVDGYYITYWTDLDNLITEESVTGTVTISSYDESTKLVIGTFSVTTSNSTITNGEFKVYLD
jgi:uncharacterized membrane protein